MNHYFNHQQRIFKYKTCAFSLLFILSVFFIFTIFFADSCYLDVYAFSKTETIYYLKLLTAGECSDLERLRMLGDKRKSALEEIHRLESMIISMDTLRNDIRNKK